MGTLRYPETVQEYIYKIKSKIDFDVVKKNNPEKKFTFGFRQKLFKDYLDGKRKMSGQFHEMQKAQRHADKCAYCGELLAGTPDIDHLIPRAKGFDPENPANLIVACKHCNRSKGKKSVYQWEDEGNEIGNDVKTKYVKLLYALHQQNDTLNDNFKTFCEKCSGNCSNQQFTQFCLEQVNV